MRLRTAVPALALTVTAAGSAHAQRPMQVAPSGRATTEVVATFVDSAARAAAQPARIRIDYGQPHLRGRRLLTDSLVPYDRPWRLGANATTTLTTDVDLAIGGARVPKGRYVLLALPARAGWKLLIQKDVGQQPVAGNAPYDATNEVARVDLRAATLPAPIESLTMWLIPATGAGAARGELRMAWGTVALSTDWALR